MRCGRCSRDGDAGRVGAVPPSDRRAHMPPACPRDPARMGRMHRATNVAEPRMPACHRTWTQTAGGLHRHAEHWLGRCLDRCPSRSRTADESGLDPGWPESPEDEEFCIQDCVRSAGVAARGDGGAGRQQHGTFAEAHAEWRGRRLEYTPRPLGGDPPDPLRGWQQARARWSGRCRLAAVRSPQPSPDHVLHPRSPVAQLHPSWPVSPSSPHRLSVPVESRAAACCRSSEPPLRVVNRRRQRPSAMEPAPA